MVVFPKQTTLHFLETGIEEIHLFNKHLLHVQKYWQQILSCVYTMKPVNDIPTQLNIISQYTQVPMWKVHHNTGK